ncbi:hypothetical protein [Streptomyces cucumeris]|uniref:hypothetical protein n=1 Tax=Streptomyces cucumeris TaxID=2962890 RepID=UPI003D71E6F0
MSEIEHPQAKAVIAWRTPEEGGRKSGPPTARVYAATCVFQMGSDKEVHPDWPSGATQLSILVQRIHTLPDGRDLAKIGFIAPDLANPFLSAGAHILIMEGPKVVARAVVQSLLGDSPR